MASNSGWDKSVPSNNSDAGLGDDEFRSVKSFQQAWTEEEHYATDGSTNSAGVHKLGSARGFTGTTSQLSNPEEGRIFFNSDNRGIYVGDASGSTWSKYVANELFPATDSHNTWTEEQHFQSTTTTDAVISVNIDGDNTNRFRIDSDGTMSWGAAVVGVDTNLYRAAADHLKTDDKFEADSLVVGGGQEFSKIESATTTTSQRTVASGSFTRYTIPAGSVSDVTMGDPVFVGFSEEENQPSLVAHGQVAKDGDVVIVVNNNAGLDQNIPAQTMRAVIFTTP